MPRKVQQKPEEVQQEAPAQEPVAAESAEEVPVKKQRGGDIHVARAKALEVLRERSAAKKKEAELLKMKQENDKKMVEMELEKERQMAAALEAKKSTAPEKKTKKKAPPPPESESETESETETESESEEERVVIKKTVYKKAVPAKTRQPQKPVGREGPTQGQILNAAYQQRMASLRESYMRQIFS